MKLANLKIQMSGDEMLEMASRHAKAMKAIRIKAISLNRSDAHVEGAYSQGPISVDWNATVSLDHNSSEIGFYIDDLSIDGLGAISFVARGFLFIRSGVQSREAWLAEMIATKLCEACTADESDRIAYSYENEIWVDIAKLVSRFGVTIDGTIAEFEISDGELILAVQPNGKPTHSKTIGGCRKWAAPKKVPAAKASARKTV